MAAPAKPLQLLHSLTTANSLTPFAHQLQALQQLSDVCTFQYSSAPLEPPTQIPNKQLVEAHCAATSKGLQQLTLLLQLDGQPASSTDPGSDCDSSHGRCSTSSTATTSAGPSSADSTGPQLSPQLSQDALQAVLLLTDATRLLVDAMRKAVTVKGHGGLMVVLSGGLPGVPSLQDFVGSIVSSGLVSSFCTACDALSATIKRHPHLKPAPGLAQQQLSTLQQLHHIAAALLELFTILAAAWPRDDEMQLQVKYTGLLNPTIRPIVRPAVRLSLAMLAAVCGPAAAMPSATDAPTSGAAAPAPPAPAPTEAASLKAALLFGHTLSNVLQDFSGGYYDTDENIAAFAADLLDDTRSSDSIFQLLLALLALTAQKMHSAAGGLSVWGDGAHADPHHLQLLEAVGLAPPPRALLDSPDATPYPYEDDTKNAASVTMCLYDVVNWAVLAARKRYLAQDPSSRCGESHMPLLLARTMSLTLLELHMLVKQKDYILMAGMPLLVAKASFLCDATEEQCAGLIQLLEAAWCKALPGAAVSVQWRGRPLVYDGSDTFHNAFQTEGMVGEVFMHYLYAAERLCPEELEAFVVQHPGAAAAGAEWGFRMIGQELMEQPAPPAINASSDDKAANVRLARYFIEHLLVAAEDDSTSSTTSTASTTSSTPTDNTSTGASDSTAVAATDLLQTLQLHPDIAATLASSFKEVQRLWLLLVTLSKFAAAVAAERPDLRGAAAATMRTTAVVAAAVLKALPASSPGRGPACMLLGRCLVGMGAAAAAAAAAPGAGSVRKLPGFCLAVVQLLGKGLAAPGILPAALVTGSSSSTTTSSSSGEAGKLILQQLEAQQTELEAALAAADGGSSSSSDTTTASLNPAVCEQLKAYGAAVCALLPQPGCCNDPCCLSFAGHSESLLGRHKCGSCQAAAFCSRECQQRAWQGHKPVCKAMAAAKPAGAARKR